VVKPALIGLGIALALGIAAALGGLYWLLQTEAGLQWALARAERAAEGKLTLEGARGRLAGTVTLERLRFSDETLTVEAKALSTHAHLAALLGARLVLDPLRAESLDIKLSGVPAAGAPSSFPLAVSLGQAEVGVLRVQRGDGLYAARNVRLAYLTIAPAAGSGASISAKGGFDVVHERFPAAVTATVDGTLDRMQLHVEAKLNEVSANIRVLLAPGEAQPVQSLEMNAGPIDVARFYKEMPRTAITLGLKASRTREGIAGTFDARNAFAGPIDASRLPVARVQGRFTTPDLASLVLEQLHIDLAGGGMLDGAGRLNASGFDGHLGTRGLNLRALRSNLRETRLAGPLEFVLTPDSQTVRGTLSQEGMAVSADAVRTGNHVDVRSLRAAARGGEVTGSGSVELGDPLRFDARVRLLHFDPSAFGDYPGGQVSGTLNAKGELGADLRVATQWALAESTLAGLPVASRGRAKVAGRRVLDVEAQASLGDTRASASGAFGAPGDRLAWSIQAPNLAQHMSGVSGRLKANGTVGGSWSAPEAAMNAEIEAVELPRGLRARRISVDVSGSEARHEARFVVLSDTGRLEGVVRGALGPQWSWRGEILSLNGEAKVAFRLRAPVSLAVSRTRVELGRFEATIGAGRLLVRELTWANERITSSGEFTGLPAQWLVIAAGLTDRVRSTLLVDGQWNIGSAPATGSAAGLEGTLQMRRVSGDLVVLDEQALELGIQGLSLDARFTSAGVGARLDLSSRFLNAALGAQIGHDPASPAIGIGRDSPLLLQGQLELVRARQLADPLVGDARFDGKLSADLNIGGTLGAPVLGGTVRGDNLAYEMPQYGMYLKSGELRATLEGDVLRLDRFSVQAGEGRFTASGTLPLRLDKTEAKINWQASKFSVLERPDLRLVASGEGTAGFDGKQLAIAGELRVDRGHFEIETRMPKLGDDVIIAGETRMTPRQRAVMPVQLNVDLDLGSNLSVRMYGLEGRVGGRVNMKTTPESELRAYGKLETVNATFYAYGQSLQVDPGIIIFDGPINNPALQITAWRRNQAVEAGVQVTGTVRAPRVQLVSQPAVSESERLSWLVLGRAPTDVTKADLGLLQAAAGALLARGDSVPLDRRIARGFGLDELSLRGSGEAQDRVVAFGKRLSDRVYVSYEQGIGTVVSSLVKVDYALSRRWSLRAETGTWSGWGIFYRFSWD
jgi:translocation and assembly module TamB